MQKGEWKLDARRATGMTVIGSLLMILGMYLFSSLASNLQPPYPLTLTFRRSDSLIAAVFTAGAIIMAPIILSLLVILFHEWCHGMAFRWAGAKPHYGAKLVGRFLPIFYATAPGHWMTRRQYMIVALTPTVVVNLLGVLLMLPPSPLRLLLILPLAVHFAGCIGDWWITIAMLQLPATTRFEDNQEGFRFVVNRPAITNS